jgi:flagellar motor switch protein FliN
MSVFTKYVETFTEIASGILGREVAVGEPLVEAVKRDQIAERLPQPGVIIATTVKEPKPSLILNYLEQPVGTLIPELIINHAATAAPSKLTELHNSALLEMMAQVWIGAGPLFANHFQAKFAPGVSDVKMQALPEYIETLPAFTAINDFILVRARIAIEGGFEGEIAQLYPAAFWASPRKKAAPAVEKSPMALEQIPIEHISSATAPRKKDQILRATEKPIRAALRDRNINALIDIPMEIAAEIGRTQMDVGKILKMSPGTIIDLDRESWQPIDLLVGGRAVAQGEIVLVNDHFGIRITKILSPTDRLNRLD